MEEKVFHHQNKSASLPETWEREQGEKRGGVRHQHECRIYSTANLYCFLRSFTAVIKVSLQKRGNVFLHTLYIIYSDNIILRHVIRDRILKFVDIII